MTSYPNLLAPLTVAGITLSNRMVMGAMHTRLETMDRPLERLAKFYATRAKGGIGLILTGGYAPTPEGAMDEGGLYLSSPEQIDEHLPITSAVRAEGGNLVLQILHAGRYAKAASCVAPSAIKARINTFTPRALTTQEVWATMASFANTAKLAQDAGYVGVEIMGSEGYLITEFTSSLTNQRDDEFGGSFENRMRFAIEVVKAVRASVSKEFLLIYRISAIDLMEGGMTAQEVAELARRIQAAGADMLNTGIGWHESGVPTMAAPVPRAAWVDAIRNVKQAVTIPVMASNRINSPEVAEEIIASGAADLVSMARPLLADPEFAIKTVRGRADEINTCIACNQACLDHIFTERVATCLVNPRAGRELDFDDTPSTKPKRIAVIGGGAAGMAFSINAAKRGHTISLYEASRELGGQLNLAKQVPGKSEFHEMLRYFRVALERADVSVQLNTRLTARALADKVQAGELDDIVIATGVRPRVPNIPGIENNKVVGYTEVLSGEANIGENVAVLGAGGIGFDVAEFLVGNAHQSTKVETFMQAWGVDKTFSTAGGLVKPESAEQGRKVTMFQRKPESLGKHLGKSTGWIAKANLRQAGVTMVAGASYESIDDQGLHVQVNSEKRMVSVDTVVLCAGQEPERALADEMSALGIKAHVIGGAHTATELDAARAIDQATRLAVAL